MNGNATMGIDYMVRSPVESGQRSQPLSYRGYLLCPKIRGTLSMVADQVDVTGEEEVVLLGMAKRRLVWTLSLRW